MGTPYVGEIRIFAGNFAPNGWAFCNGQLVPISEYETLFNLIGTTYGGDGQETFGLPDLQGRVPVHMGQGSGLSNYVIGQMAGVESVTLTQQQLPNHTHALTATTAPGTGNSPAGNTFAQSSTVKLYTEDATTVNLAPTSILATGGSQPHDNFQPSLALNFIISFFGVYPSPT